VTNPLFWLVLSLLFVTVSLTIVLIVAIPTFKELSRAARSAEKLFETLRREFPPTLEAIRLTGLEISDLTDELQEGVQSAGQVAKQVDQTLADARRQARKVQHGTRSLAVGLRSAWKTLMRPQPPRRSERLPGEPDTLGLTELPASTRPPLPDALDEFEATDDYEAIAEYLPAHRPLPTPAPTRFIAKAGELVEELGQQEDGTAR